ncbi:MAG: hypothetical protein J6Y06_06395 [Bacteroidales bacterium]|nr:hypothetical protein [Bacteroidales bacterium]
MSSTSSYKEIKNLVELPAPDESGRIDHYVFQYINFNQAPQYVAARHRFTDCCFFGCDIPAKMEDEIGSSCLVFPRMGMTYNVFRSHLYNGDSLYAGYDPENEDTFSSCFDQRVYSEYIQQGKQTGNIKETLARSLHDHAIADAMGDFLSRFEERQVVAVMGGHALKRTDESFKKVAYISKVLSEKGKLMASGGGPGAMEATHFGAWMAGRKMEEFEDALEMISIAPTFRDPGWLKSAFEVRKKYPQEKYRSLGIPTWFYGHEPATPFATDIAKYFMNSVREDILLSAAKGGIIYSPGSAGTLQEIFQDAAQNHYQSMGYPSPMVFLGEDYYSRDVPVYPMLENLLSKGFYNSLLLSITDDADEAISNIMSFTEQ